MLSWFVYFVAVLPALLTLGLRNAVTGCGGGGSALRAALCLAPKYEHVWLVRGASDSYSPFSSNKLLMSLYRSCQHRLTALNDAAALSETIIQKLQPKFIDGQISSQTIVQVSQVALNRFDQAASVHYSANHR
jgi:hypothetical protein